MLGNHVIYDAAALPCRTNRPPRGLLTTKCEKGSDALIGGDAHSFCRPSCRLGLFVGAAQSRMHQGGQVDDEGAGKLHLHSCTSPPRRSLQSHSRPRQRLYHLYKRCAPDYCNLNPSTPSRPSLCKFHSSASLRCRVAWITKPVHFRLHAAGLQQVTVRCSATLRSRHARPNLLQCTSKAP